MFSRLLVSGRVEIQKERNRRIDLEKRSGANGHELESGKIERDDITITGWGVMKDIYTVDLGVGEKRSIKFSGFLGFFVKPEMGDNFLHIL